MCALYKGTIAVRQIVGKVGDVDFMRWRNKNVVRESPKIVTNPNTPAQVSQRAAVAAAHTRWKTILNPDQKARWESYAQYLSVKKFRPAGVRQIPQGNKGIMTGLNAYIAVSTKMVSAGQPTVNDAPVSDPRRDGATGLTALWNVVGPVVDVIWQVPVGVLAGDVVRIWVDSVQEIFHRQIATTALCTVGTVSFLIVRGVAGASVDLSAIGTNQILVQADTVGQNGELPGATETVEVAIP